MARYELGAVYKIKSNNDKTYYVRLLENDCYGVYEPFDGVICEEIVSTTSFRLYFVCNTMPVKRGVWEKVLPSQNKTSIHSLKEPLLVNYGNFDPEQFLQQHKAFLDGNLITIEKEDFIDLVTRGMIKKIFNRHEIVPDFLDQYYDEWPNSYILDKTFLANETKGNQMRELNALKEMGYNINND